MADQDSLLVPKHLNRRLTAAGAGLRLDLDRASAHVPAIPPGKKGRVVVGYKDGSGEVGAAWLTDQGWEVGAAVKAAVRDNRGVEVVGGITW